MQVTESPMLVGRSSHCQLIIDDPSVSSSHAELSRRAGVVFVRDLNSTNGTMVDGAPVNGEATVATGSIVQFGLVRYLLNGTDLVEAPAAGPGATQIVGGAPRVASAAGSGPASAPSATPPAQESSGAVVSPGLVGWTRGLFAGYTALIAVGLLAVVLTFIYFEKSMNSFGDSFVNNFDKFETWETVYGVVYLIAIAVSIPIAVLLIIWAHQAHRASDALSPGSRKWGHGWSIGAWFVPLANYILVPLMLNEIHKISSAPRSQNQVDRDWPREKTNPMLILWFVLYLIGAVLLLVGNTALGERADEGSYRGGLIMALVGLGAVAAASVLAATVIRDVSAKLAALRSATS